ncbi:MAG: rod shape-determining protein MreC [Clostridia bacterium]|nr:rod shape-determining protein MreC [Clostridia bacterium]
MKRKSTKGIFVTLIFLTVLILTLMAVSTLSKDRAMLISDFAGTVAQPFQSAIAFMSDKITEGVQVIAGAPMYARENEELRLRIAQLEEAARDIETYKNENDRLRELLDMKRNSPAADMIGATVIASDIGNWTNTFTIDKGSNDGVSVGNAVLTPDGLAGCVSEVGLTWAKVQTIIDASISVGAVCGRTNDRGIVEGSLSLSRENRCVMNYLNKSSTIVVGDNVETSGISGTFPPGLFIGKVISVETKDNGLSVAALIEPAVDFSNLSEVLVRR